MCMMIIITIIIITITTDTREVPARRHLQHGCRLLPDGLRPGAKHKKNNKNEHKQKSLEYDKEKENEKKETIQKLY